MRFARDLADRIAAFHAIEPGLIGADTQAASSATSSEAPTSRRIPMCNTKTCPRKAPHRHFWKAARADRKAGFYRLEFFRTQKARRRGSFHRCGDEPERCRFRLPRRELAQAAAVVNGIGQTDPRLDAIEVRRVRFGPRRHRISGHRWQIKLELDRPPQSRQIHAHGLIRRPREAMQ